VRHLCDSGVEVIMLYICMSYRHLSCLLSISILAVGASPDDEKCADCEPCDPCLGCVALPAPYNEGLSPEEILALVGIGSNSSGGEALLKRLFGNDFELSMRNAPECVECTECLPCIDCCEYIEREDWSCFHLKRTRHACCLILFYYACFTLSKSCSLQRERRLCPVRRVFHLLLPWVYCSFRALQ